MICLANRAGDFYSISILYNPRPAPGARHQNILHARDVTQAPVEDRGLLFWADHVDIGTRVHAVAGGNSLSSPGAYPVHYLQRGGLPVMQSGRGRHHDRVHHVRIKLHDGGEGIEVTIQDCLAAELEPARRISQARSLQRAGGGEGMSLGGAGPLVRSADNGHAVDQLPMVRICQGIGERVLVRGPGLPLDESAGDRARCRARAAPRQAREILLAQVQSRSFASRQCQRRERRSGRGDSRPGGEVVPGHHLGAVFDLCHVADQIQNIRNSLQPGPRDLMPVDDQLIERQRRLKADRRTRE